MGKKKTKTPEKIYEESLIELMKKIKEQNGNLLKTAFDAGWRAACDACKEAV